MKKNLAIVILLIFSNIYSQEIITTLNNNSLKNKDVFQTVDEINNEITFYFNNKESTLIVNFNSNFEIKDSLRFSRPEKNSKSIIGFAKKDKFNFLYWTKLGSNEIIAQKIDLENKIVSQSKFLINYKYERDIIKFSKNNKFYTVSVINNSNQLKIHIFDGFEKSENIVDIKDIALLNSLKEKVNLYELLDDNFLPFERAFNPQLIDDRSPVTLTSSAKRIKYYIKNNKLLLTFDNNNIFTYLISIDLDNFNSRIFSITKPFINETENTLINSNSIVFNNSIAQIKLDSQQMFLTFKDFDNNLIQEYNVLKKDSISFKNSDIIQLGSEFNSKDVRKLENTSQFLRKVSNLNAGLSFYKMEEKYQVVIGSVSEIKNNNSIYAGMFGISGIILHHMITNPTYDNFNSYSNRKVVYINSVFDDYGKFHSDKHKKNAFDKIETYDIKNNSSKTIFKYFDDYIYAYFDTTKNNYVFRKFKD